MMARRLAPEALGSGAAARYGLRMNTDYLSEDGADRVAAAAAVLRRGRPLALDGAGARWLFAAPEAAPPEALDAFRALGRPFMALGARRAATLKLRAYDGDIARAVIPPDMTAAMAASLADPALDLDWPMRGPLRTLREGDASGARAALALAVHAGLMPAALMVETAAARSLPSLAVDALAGLSGASLRLTRFAGAAVPLSLAPGARLHGFRPSDGGPDHYAVVIGDPPREEPVLTRLHSECFTGDLLGSLKCDCGPQLRGALARIAAEGGGVLLYLAQEGRGIGMANKLRAYALQDQGWDTVEANHRLGFEDDLRDFRVAALMLRALGVETVRLMSNNPRKSAALEAHGLRVASLAPHRLGHTAENDAYLRVKAGKSGHLL